jgi:hypothetical protein
MQDEPDVQRDRRALHLLALGDARADVRVAEVGAGLARRGLPP